MKSKLLLSTIILASIVVSCTTDDDTSDGNPLYEQLVINEIQASNSQFADDAGEFDDWIEIYNAGTDAVDMGGMYMTDDLDDAYQWQIPTDSPDATTVPAGGFLILWADSDPEQGAIHLDFKLSGGGEDVGLYEPEGATIDEVTYPELPDDAVWVRATDGGETWIMAAEATPGATNVGASTNFPPLIADASINPAVPTPDDNVTVSATITDETDVASATLYWRLDEDWNEIAMVLAEGSDDLWDAIIPAQADSAVVEYYLQAADDSGASRVWPALAPDEVESYMVFAEPVSVPMLVVNEFLASNDAANMDEYDEYDDWMELYNPGTSPVDLNGLYLTDDPADPQQFLIDAGGEYLLQPGEYQIIWCDNDFENGQGVFHTNFKLSGSGEFVGITATDGATFIDSLTYTEQTTDISFGRVPDGSDSWQFIDPPTPGASNGN